MEYLLILLLSWIISFLMIKLLKQVLNEQVYDDSRDLLIVFGVIPLFGLIVLIVLFPVAFWTENEQKVLDFFKRLGI